MGIAEKAVWLIGALSLWFGVSPCRAFVVPTTTDHHLRERRPVRRNGTMARSGSSAPWRGQVLLRQPVRPSLLPLLDSSSGYVPPAPEDSSVATQTTRALWPQIGDIVRFYDVLGGDERGEVLVGRISFIQKNLGDEGSGWTLELSELDDVGSGYYADYPFRKRGSKKTVRDLAAVSPIAASFVRSEDAYKLPLDPKGAPRVRAENYEIETYPGPFAGENAINQEVVQADAEIYGALKSKLLRYVALTGMAGTVLTDLIKGPEDAAIYFAGAVASLLYFFFLTVKTDTVASQEAKLGSNVSNLRFATPLIVLGTFYLFV